MTARNCIKLSAILTLLSAGLATSSADMPVGCRDGVAICNPVSATMTEFYCNYPADWGCCTVKWFDYYCLNDPVKHTVKHTYIGADGSFCGYDSNGHPACVSN